MNDIVLLNLRISMWGISRVLPSSEYEVDADKAMIRASKKILECPEYEFLLQLKRGIQRRLRTLALPGEILRAGVYPVSVAMVETVEKTLGDYLAQPRRSSNIGGGMKALLLRSRCTLRLWRRDEP